MCPGDLGGQKEIWVVLELALPRVVSHSASADN